MFKWFKKLFNSRKADKNQRKTGSFNLTNELIVLAQEYKNECEYLKDKKYTELNSYSITNK